MNLRSQLQMLEAVVDSWQPPLEPPMEKLQRTAESMGLPLDRVVKIWKEVSAHAPDGLFGAALLCYIAKLNEARHELSGAGEQS